MSIPRVALAALLVAPFGLEAQLPPGIDDGGLYLSAAGGRFEPATTLGTEIDIDVTGIVAEVSIRQRFSNTGKDWVEGNYVFPLPDDAAVNELVMQIGERRIEGEIAEREQAKQAYEHARAAGHQASLVEQERPNLFTTSVANIAPGQEVLIEIGFTHMASYADGAFELRLPMTMTPRYVTEQVADAARISPPVRNPRRLDSHRSAVQISINAGMPLAEAGSDSHALAVEDSGNQVRLTTASGPVPMDRDLVVSWRPVADQSPSIVAFNEQKGEEDFMLLMYLPPARGNMVQTTPRELVFVIDTSGSMGGNSMARARTALQWALGRLEPSDRFNIIEFNNEARALYAAPVAFNKDTLDRARRFVGRLKANGGTNIASALTLALGQPATSGLLQQIVFITDGSVGNEAELFQLVRDQLGDARLFTVGIGAAPNTHFMRKTAQFGRGSFLHIGAASDVVTGMQQLFARLEHVAMTDIEIDWPWPAEVYPERVPDLYRGQPVVVAARTTAGSSARFSAMTYGKAGGFEWSERIEATPGSATGIASIWARRKIESLLDLRLEGLDEQVIRQAVLETALAHDLLSPYTSLIAVDRTPERSRDALLRREALGNLAPAGSDIARRLATLPGTATHAPVIKLIGVLLCLVVAAGFGLRRHAILRRA